MKKKLLRTAISTLALVSMLMQNTYGVYAAVEGFTLPEVPEIVVEHEDTTVDTTSDSASDISVSEESKENNTEGSSSEQPAIEVSTESGTTVEAVDGDLDVTEEKPTSDVSYDDQVMPISETESAAEDKTESETEDTSEGLAVSSDENTGDEALDISVDSAEDEAEEPVVDTALDANIDILENQIAGTGLDSVEVFVNTDGLNNTDTFKIAFVGVEGAIYDAIVNDTLDKSAGGTYKFTNLDKQGFNIRAIVDGNVKATYSSYAGVPTITLVSEDDNAEAFLEADASYFFNNSPIFAIHGYNYKNIEFKIDTEELTDDARFTFYVETEADATVNGESPRNGISNLTKANTSIVVNGLDDKEFTAYIVSSDDSHVTSVATAKYGEAVFTLSSEEKGSELVHTYKDSKVEVTVTLQNATDIPAGAELKVDEIKEGTDEYEEVSALLEKEREASESSVSQGISIGKVVYDIKFVLDGNEVEPANPAKVDINFIQPALEDVSEGTSDEVVNVYHAKENLSGEVVEIENVTEKVEMASEGGIDEIAFELGSFSLTIAEITTASWKKGAYEYKQVNKKDGFELLDGYYRSNLALGMAGNFHIVAFDKAKLNVHTNGNVLCRVLDAGEFGTRQLDKELTYVQDEVINFNKWTDDIKKTDFILALGSSMKVASQDNSDQFKITNTRGAKKNLYLGTTPFIIYQDKDTSKDPFVDLAGVKSYIEKKNKEFREVSDFCVTKEFLNENARTLTLDVASGCGYITVKASEIADRPIYVKGFREGCNGSIVVNVDCQNKSSIALKEVNAFIGDKKIDRQETGSFTNGRIIWNFFNYANNATISWDNVFGQVIAPNANLVINNGNGNFIGKNVTISGETHRTDFEGTTTPANTEFKIEKVFTNGDGNWPKEGFKFHIEPFGLGGVTTGLAPETPIKDVVIKEDTPDHVASFGKVTFNYKDKATWNGSNYYDCYMYKITEEYPTGNGVTEATEYDEEDGTLLHYAVKDGIYYLKDPRYIKIFVNYYKDGTESRANAQYKWGVGILYGDCRDDITGPIKFKNKYVESKGGFKVEKELATAANAQKTFYFAVKPMEKTTVDGQEVLVPSSKYLKKTTNGYLEDTSLTDDAVYSVAVAAGQTKSTTVDFSDLTLNRQYKIVELKRVETKNGTKTEVSYVETEGFDGYTVSYKNSASNATDGTVTVKKDGSLETVTIKNTYSAAETYGDVSVDKKLTGRALKVRNGVVQEPFKINVAKVYAENADGMTIKKSSINVNASSKFEASDVVEFTKAGTYVVSLKEDPNATANHVENSKDTIYVKYVVQDNTLGSLTVTSTEYYKNCTTLGVCSDKWTGTPYFENTYNDTASIDFKILKNLDGKELGAAPTFKFWIETVGQNQAGYDAKYTRNEGYNHEKDKDGNDRGAYVVFDTANYGLNDTGDYVYIIYEDTDKVIDGDKNSIQNDASKYEVTVHVGIDSNDNLKAEYTQIIHRDSDGNTLATITGDELKKYQLTADLISTKYMTFNNYTEKPAVIKATKAFTDNKKSVAGYRFQFKDVAKNTTSDPILTDTEGVATYNPTDLYTLEDVGNVYEYTVKELLPENVTTETEGVSTKDEKGVDLASGLYRYQGIIYDTNEYPFYVVPVNDNGNLVIEMYSEVGEDEDGALLLDSTKKLPAGITITNDYTVNEVSVNLVATKKFNGAALSALSEDKGTFTFDAEYIPNDDDDTFTYSSSKSLRFDADSEEHKGLNKYVNADDEPASQVTFAPITFTEKGTYYFSIVENRTNALSTVDYDETEYEAVVVVEDNGSGSLEIATGYPKYYKVIDGKAAGTPVETIFNNYDYRGQATLKVEKVLKDRNGNDLPADSREVVDSEYAFTVSEVELNDENEWVKVNGGLSASLGLKNAEATYTLPEVTSGSKNYNVVKHYLIEEIPSTKNNDTSVVTPLVDNILATVTYSYVETDGVGSISATTEYANISKYSTKNSGSSAAAVFENRWSASAATEFSGTKTYVGGKFETGKFKVRLYDSAHMPTDSNLSSATSGLDYLSEADVKTSGKSSVGTFAFSGLDKDNPVSQLTYTEADAGKEYTYYMREFIDTSLLPSSDNDTPYIDADGVRYDERVVQVVVKVTYNPDDNVLEANIVDDKSYIVVWPESKAVDSEGQPVSFSGFINTNTSVVTAQVGASKKLVAKKLKDTDAEKELDYGDREFNIYLLDDDANKTKLAEKTLKYDEETESYIKEAIFTNDDVSALKFDESDLGEGLTASTRYFYLVEEHYNEATLPYVENNVTYDSKRYKVAIQIEYDETSDKVVVSDGYPKYYEVDKNWELVNAEDTGSTAAPVFKNVYEAVGDFNVTIKKTLIGRPVEKGDSVSFNIREYNGAIQDATTITIDAVQQEDGTWAFPTTTKKIATFNQTDLNSDGKNTKYYVLTESDVNTEKFGGITENNETYLIKVDLEDNGSGTINVTQTYRELHKEAIEAINEAKKLEKPFFVRLFTTLVENIKETFETIIDNVTSWFSGKNNSDPVYEFINYYEAKASIGFSAIKVMDTVGSDKIDYDPSFTFELYIDGNKVQSIENIKRNPETKLFDEVFFTDYEYVLDKDNTASLSRHTFEIKEKNGNTDNISYSTDVFKYVIEPVNNTKTGKIELYLVTEVTDEETNETREVKTPLTADANNRVEMNKVELVEFENHYVDDCDITFNGTKISKYAPNTAADDEFEVVITAVDKATGNQYLIKDSETSEGIAELTKMVKKGPFTLPTIYFNQDDLDNKSLEFTIKERKAGSDVAGIYYDPTVHKVDVTLSVDENGKLKATYSEPENTGFVFTNIYHREDTFPLTAKKSLNGASPAADRVYSFDLQRLTASGSADSDYKVVTKTNDGALIEFSGVDCLKFTEADIEKSPYFYVMTEQHVGATPVYAADDEEKTTPIGYELNNTIYSAKELYVRADVSDVGAEAGRLNINYSFFNTFDDAKNNENELDEDNGDFIGFENKYSASNFIEIAGNKELQNKSIVTFDGGFTVELHTANGVYTAKVDSNGDYKFTGNKNAETSDSVVYVDELYYELDENKNETGTYIYTVNESVAGTTPIYAEDDTEKKTPIGYEKNGVKYDTVEYEVKAVVADEKNGTLSVDVSNEVSKTSDVNHNDDAKNGTLNFNNKYESEGYIDLVGYKRLDGRDLSSDEFSFTITETEFNGKAASKKNTATVKNNGEEIKFSHAVDGVGIDFLNYDLSQVGTHVYEITEDSKAKLAGVTYSQAVYRLTVEAKDAGDGNITAEVVKREYENVTDKEIDFIKDKGDFAFGFVNAFKATGYIDLAGTKYLEGKNLEADDSSFTFYISDGVNTAEVKNNGAEVLFSHVAESNAALYNMLNFDKAGTYTFTISEKKSEKGAAVTSDDAVYIVTVEVTNTYDKHGKITDELASTVTSVVKKNSAESSLEIPQATPAKVDNTYRFNDVFTFTNKYKATADISFAGKKTVKNAVNGQDITDDSVAGKYKFMLYEYPSAENRANYVNRIGQVGEDAVTDATGKFTIKVPQYTQESLLNAATGKYETKTYYYKALEYNPVFRGQHATEPVVVDDVTYDITEYDINVTVAATDNNHLSVDVKLINADGTESTLSKSGSDGTYVFSSLDFTNIVTKTTNIEGEKHWVDSVTDATKRPDVKLTLLANGIAKDTYIIKASASDRTYKFENLPVVDDNGVAITYDVVEEPIDGYVSSKAATDKGFDFFNTAGKITILKVSAGSGEPLAGAELAILDASGKEIEKWTSELSAHPVAALLTPGATYTLRELSAPKGYAVAKDQTFTVPADGSDISVTMVDEEIVGSVRLKKVDAETRNALVGAEFALYRENGSRVSAIGTTGDYTYTDKTSNSVFTVNAAGDLTVSNLPYGTYYFVEVTAPKGYVLSSEKYGFSILKNGESAEVTVPNPKEMGSVRLRKTNADGSRTLSGAVFELYAKTPSTLTSAIASTLFSNAYYRVGTYTTDATGVIYVDKLPWDDYYFIEVKAPSGYKINKDTNGDPIVYTFKIGETTANGLQVDLGNVTNKLVSTPDLPDLPTPPSTPSTPSTPSSPSIESTPSTPAPVAPEPGVAGERITPTAPAVDDGRRPGGVIGGVLGVRAAPKQGVLGERVGPVTGDTANIIIWITVMALCIAAIIGAALFGNRKTRRRKI